MFLVSSSSGCREFLLSETQTHSSTAYIGPSDNGSLLPRIKHVRDGRERRSAGAAGMEKLPVSTGVTELRPTHHLRT